MGHKLLTHGAAGIMRAPLAPSARERDGVGHSTSSLDQSLTLPSRKRAYQGTVTNRYTGRF
jgi:hypothetical protein